MDYDLFETYIVLCETGNITKTAELLHKTQPAVSKRIQQLEDQLGFTLIQRSKGKKEISITKKGMDFLEIAQKFMTLYGEIQTKESELSNTLTISSIDSLNSSVCGTICNEIINRYQTKISLLTNQTPDAYRLVSEKAVDVAFVSLPQKMRGVICKPVFSFDYVVVKYSFEPGPEQIISTADLNPEEEIYQRWSDSFSLWHREHFKRDSYRIRCDAFSSFMKFIRTPNSWAITQRINLQEISRSIPVQVYSLSDPPPARICYMLTNSYPDRINFKTISQFKKLVKEYTVKHHIEP